MPPTASARTDYDPTLFGNLKLRLRNVLQRAVQAIIVGGAGAVITVSVCTYSPFDTTKDTAGPEIQVQNVLGEHGAGFANVLLQALGWAALPLGLLLMYAAARAMIKPRIGMRRRDLLRRSGLLTGTVLFLAIFLAAFPIPQNWSMATGLGGLVGDTFFFSIKNLFMGLKINPAISGGMTVFLAFVGLGYSFGRFLGIVGRDVAEIFDAAGLVWAIFRVWLDRLIAFIKKRFYKSYVEPEERAGFEDRVLWVERPGAETGILDETPSTPEQRGNVYHPPVKSKKEKTRMSKPAKRSAFKLPRIDLLKMPPSRVAVNDSGALQKSAEELGEVLSDFGVKGEIGTVRPGPVVTLYEFEPAPGVKSSRVINLSDDIARSMAAQSARVAVVPGRNAIGIEMPNRCRETVYLREMLASRAFKTCGAALPLAMGEDIGGKPFFADLAKMPHLLVAGTTGSGKSVGINAMILSLMYTLSPEQCKFIMIDPKMLELSVYDGAPHLLTPVVTEPKKAVVALKWAVREMEARYRNMSKMGVRSIAGFNEKIAAAKQEGEHLTRKVMTGYDKQTGEPIYETETLDLEFMPFIVLIIDEMADLMMVAGKEIEGAVQRLAQMARAAGIHMIMATQRPSVDVITGTIKANFPTRVSFQVTSKIDSRTILGEQGAEQLLGMGDMLFMAGGGQTRRLHGPFVSDNEVEKIANFVKAQGAPSYLEDVTVERDEDGDLGLGSAPKSGDETFDKVIAIVTNDRKCSTSYIQRRLGIGYNRAANLVERMEAEGMIGPAGPGGKREIFLPEAETF